MRRILVGMSDEAYSTAATQMAVDIARPVGATVTAIGILDLVRLHNVGPVPIGAGAAAAEMRRERSEKASAVISHCIDVFTTACQAAGVDFAVHRDAGNAIKSLINASRYHDLLVCGLKGMFEHGVMEEPREELRTIIESGVRPLIAVSEEHRPTHKVLLAYSGSVESAATLRQYGQLNPFPNAEHKLIHFGDSGPEGDQLLEDASAYLAAHGIKTTRELVAENPRHGLLTFASGWEADMIVIGNSAKSLLRRRVFGETALQAMSSSKVPLFLGQ